MPPIKVRDKTTGKMNTIEWGGKRPPTRVEILKLIEQDEGSKVPAPGNIDTETTFRPLSMPNAGMGTSTFGKITGTMWGTDESVLPPVPGITRPLLPSSQGTDWQGWDDMKYLYENVVRPSSSAVGLASDWLTGKAVGAVAKPVIGAAKSMFGRGAAASAEALPTALPKRTPLRLTERAESAPTHYAVDEKGIATDVTRPYSPVEKRPFDPRTVRGPSGNIDPATGLVERQRQGGRFVESVLDPPPTVKASELPVIDIPSETSAAYPVGDRSPKSRLAPNLPPGASASERAAHAKAVARREAEIKRGRQLSPTDASVRSGPVSKEYAGAPQARRVGETRDAFKSRVAAGDKSPLRATIEKDVEKGHPAVTSLLDKIRGFKSGATTTKRPGFGERIRSETGAVGEGKVKPLTAEYSHDWPGFNEDGSAEKFYKLRGGQYGPEGSDVTAATLKELGLKVPPDVKRPGIFTRMKSETGAIGEGPLDSRVGGPEPRYASMDGAEKLKEALLTGGKLPDVPALGIKSTKPAITLEKPSLFSKGGRNRIKAEMVDALNIPRALMASGEFSGTLRQAATVIHRKEFYKSIPKSMRAAFDEKFFEAGQAKLTNRPSFPAMKKAKLALTDLGNASGREELFMSKLAERIPVIGKVVRGSGRAHVTLLNEIRAEMFDNLRKEAKSAGSKVSTRDLAKYINSATGRGDLGKIERHAPVLNAAFFSPRLMKSRLDFLNPVNYTTGDPFVRKQYLKSMASLGTFWTTALAAAHAGGAEVELDPRSSDFAKIKIGDTRFDVGAGFQQYLRVAAQIAPEWAGGGKYKDTTTGKLTELGGKPGERSEFDIIESFFSAKAAPLVSLAITHYKRKTFTGAEPKYLPDVGELKSGVKPALDELSKSELVKRLTPMFTQDLYDLYKEDPSMMAKAFVPLAFGIGSNVQKRRKKRRAQ